MWAQTGAPLLLTGALLVWALGAPSAVGAEECPRGCSCSRLQELDLYCELPRGNISVKGVPRSSIKIVCEPDCEGFTVDELPQMEYGRNASIRLELEYCPPPPSFTRAAPRLGAAHIEQLYIRSPPGGVELTPGHVAGLDHLERLCVYGDLPDDPISVPPSVLAALPALRHLTISQARVNLTSHNLTALINLIHLELGSCHLQRIPDRAFSGLHKLERLFLSNNNLEELTAQQLLGLVSLQQLSIPSNWLTSLRGVASSLPSLRVLSAFNNRFHVLPALTNLTKLEQVDIFNNNGSMKVSPRALAGLPQLTSVNLAQSMIEDIPADFLSGSINVKVLLLPRNRLKQLPVGVFGDQAALEQLDLSGNQLETLPSRLLEALARLKTLKLDHNILLQLPSDLLVGVSSLRTLSVSHNRLNGLRASSLAGAPRLAEINLSHNNITERDRSGGLDEQRYEEFGATFNSLTSLRVLDLSYNNLSAVPPSISSVELERLDLSHNRIHERYEEFGATFNSLTSLRVLDLSYNNLSAVPPSISSVELERLDLSHNRIHERYEEFGATFNSLTSLRVLDLSYNNLSAVPPSISSVELERLDLSHNRIHEVYNVNFWSSHAVIYLNQNEIERVYLYPGVRETELPAELAVPVTRSTLYLDDNHSFICDCQLYPLAQRFHGFRALDTSEPRFEANKTKCASPPSLANHTLPSIPLSSFACDVTPCPAHCLCAYRPHTRTLELVCTRPPLPEHYPDTTDFGDVEMQLKLSNKPTSLVIGEQIRLLNLSGLELQELPSGLSIQNLTLLDLSSNNFSAIPHELFEGELKLRLANNPIACDCWHLEDITYLNDNLWKVDDSELINCTSGVSFIKLDVAGVCSTWRAALIGGTLALLGLLGALLGLLLLRYSLEVRAWLYARGLLADWWADDDERQYDAFVSFCHKDEQFVKEHLLPTLESGPQPYKLCIHYRDWLPGEFITTQIARSVADSRRTIIVVSRNFLNSEWARAEFRTANMTAIKERKARVIAVLLEDVHSHKELDPELKAYLSTNTYLKWGDPWFWDKLKYSLRHRKADKLRKGKADVVGEKRKMALDARLTANGVIINAANLNKQHYPENIKLDICTIDKKKCLA